MKRTMVFGIVALSTLALAACSSSSSGTPTSSDGSKKVVSATVGVLPIADTAPIYLGVKKGFFTDEGIDLKIETATGGAAIVPAVVSGDYQFGFSNLISTMLAEEKSLPISIVAVGPASTGDPASDFGGVIVSGDSSIKTAADLEGKTVSTNSLGNINDTIIRTAIDAAGGDSSKTKFVELAFPDAVAAVANKQVDAAFEVEPFVTTALDAGDRIVTGTTYADFDPKLDISGYFTSRTADPTLVKEFTAAMKKSQAYATAHPDEVRAIIATYTKTSPDVLAKIVLPLYPEDFDSSAVSKLSGAALKYKVLTKEPAADFLP